MKQMQQYQDENENDQSESQSMQEDENIVEEHTNWKQNVPFLYDIAICKELNWPSLTVQWFKDIEINEEENEIHKLLIGTNTSGNDQNFIKILQVVLPKVIDDTMDPTLTNNIRKIQKVGQVNEVYSISHPCEVNRARYMTQASNIIAAWTDCGDIYLYDTKQDSNKPTSKLLYHRNEGYGLSWSELKKGTLLSGGHDRAVAVWDIESGSQKPIRDFKIHKQEVEDVSWHSQNPNLFATCSCDCTIAFIDIRGDSSVQQYKAHEQEINSIQFNPQLEFLFITGSQDKTIKLFDLRKPDQELHTFEQHDEAVNTLQWANHDKRYFASGSQDRRVIVWDISKIGSEIKAEDERDGPAEMEFIHGGHQSKINDLNWNPNQPFIISSVEDGFNSLQIWRMQRSVLEDEEDEQLIIEEMESSKA